MASYDDTATVSGSVAYFSDGADEVPCKSVKVTLPASLNGYTSVTEAQIPSRNMASMSDADFTLNSVRYKTENGILYINGTSTGETSSNDNAFKALDFWLPSGTYFFNRGNLLDLNVATYLRKYDDKSQIKANTGSFTLTENTHLYISFYVYNKVFSNLKATIYINLGSTAIAYEDTAPVTTYSANLGRTVHGAEVDLANGEGTDNTTRIQIKDRTWTITEVGSSFKVFTCNKIATKELNFNFQVEGYENAETYRNYLQDKQCGTYNTTNAMDRIVIRDDSYTTVEDFLSAVGDNYIVFENTTPTDFTFTGQEVPTRLGYNAFWSDSGDTELTYYKSGYGFTSVTIHKETPDGEPVEQTAKFHRIVYGGQADVVKGTCEPKNLIYPKYEGRTNAGITYTVNSDHSITCQGVASATSWVATNLSGHTEKMQLFPAGKYTVSGGVSSNVRVYCGGIYTDGTTPYLPHDTGSGATITLEKPAYLYPQIRIESGTDLTTPVTIYIQLEAGSSASDYVPHFEPFTFPPISMGTDEGENTLFANEGGSAITYRKAVD